MVTTHMRQCYVGKSCAAGRGAGGRHARVGGVRGDAPRGDDGVPGPFQIFPTAGSAGEAVLVAWGVRVGHGTPMTLDFMILFYFDAIFSTELLPRGVGMLVYCLLFCWF